MPVSAPELFEQTLPSTVYPQLSLSLVNMMRCLPGVARLITDAELVDIGEETKRFTVLTSKSFSALVYEISAPDGPAVRLTFEPHAIATFLDQLYRRCHTHPHLQQLTVQVMERQAHKSNEAKLQSQFTLQSLAAMSQGTSDPSRSLNASPSEDPGLYQQATPERLLNQVITQICQNLDLPLILSTAVNGVCQFLRADRVVIYEFPSAASSPPHALDQTAPLSLSGSVNYEAKASSEISSVLHYQEPLCSISSQDFLQKYQQGQTLSVPDIEQHYSTECLLSFLQSIQVRALLVVPIVVNSQLWGLLIAHQCGHPRQWQPHEQDLLKRMGDHLAIAIRQFQLLQPVQQQQQTLQTLEEQGTQNTQDLHTALGAAPSPNQTKSNFLATMSHELRTPLTCVIGLSATLLRWSLGPLTEKQRSCLQTIHDSGEHLLDLINDILDFSHVQSGKATLNLSELSLTTLMQQIMQVMRNKADAHGVQLKANLKIPQERDRFIADLHRIQQILISLTDNAIKFTPMGGKVTLRVWVETNTVVFQVEDTGIGIAPSQLPHLFEKFQQLDATYRRTYEGAGLGLALAQQCVTLHQGWIDVSSIEGQGSIFTVQLPNQSTSALTQASRPKTISGGRLVLIESNEEEATLLCDMFTAGNYQVIWMIEASAAIDQIRFLQPIAVIVDAQLPAQGCISLIRRLRELPTTNSIKIIVLTREESIKDHQQYLSLGADAYLLKSLATEDLLRKIEVLLTSAAMA